MSFINPADLTFNGEEVKSLSEAVMTAFHKKPTITEFHTLIKGIKAKKQIAIIGILGLTGKKGTGCTITENSGGVSMSEKFWDPEYITDRFAQCWDDLKESFFVWSEKNGLDKPNLDATDFAKFLQEQVGDSMLEAAFRHVWLSDVDAANYDDSPAGVITNGIDVNFFNSIDGFWKQLMAIGVANTDQRVTISKNSEATYSAQKFDSTDTTNQVVTEYFQTMIDNADERLTAEGDVVIICTKTMADQYKRERKKATGIEPAYIRVEKGIQKLEVDGYTIYAFSFLDRHIKAYFNNGTKWYLPHRAVLTTKTNLQVGTEEESNLSTMDAFYDKVTKKYFVDYGFNLDAKIIEDYKVMVAY